MYVSVTLRLVSYVFCMNQRSCDNIKYRSMGCRRAPAATESLFCKRMAIQQSFCPHLCLSPYGANLYVFPKPTAIYPTRQSETSSIYVKELPSDGTRSTDFYVHEPSNSLPAYHLLGGNARGENRTFLSGRRLNKASQSGSWRTGLSGNLGVGISSYSNGTVRIGVDVVMRNDTVRYGGNT